MKLLDKVIQKCSKENKFNFKESKEGDKKQHTKTQDYSARINNMKA